MVPIDWSFPTSKLSLMTLSTRSILCVLMALALLANVARGAELKPYSGSGCSVVDDYFVEEVWAKVAAESCLKCHKAGGDAEDSKLVLLDPARLTAAKRTEALRANRAAFAAMALVKEGNSSRLLLKATGIKFRPEHIHEALREYAGIASHAHAKKFPLGVTDKEKLRKLWG